MIVVASGSRYLDIDAYAGCVALAELLNLLGREAVAAGSAPLNESVTAKLRALDVPFDREYTPTADDKFVIVDLSEPEYFDRIVDPERVIAVYDHHPGFEDVWQKLRGTCRIESVGAAATLIYERWVEAGRLERISQASAQLLAAAILDNTLNFQAGVTTDRDRKAFENLAKVAGLDDAWVAGYFNDCQESILADLPAALTSDTKFPRFPGLEGELCTGQLVVWDAGSVLESQRQAVTDTLDGLGNPWLMNLVSISEGKSYFMSDDDAVREWAHGLLDVKFDGQLAVADRLWLRKEIMKAAINRYQETKTD